MSKRSSPPARVLHAAVVVRTAAEGWRLLIRKRAGGDGLPSDVEPDGFWGLPSTAQCSQPEAAGQLEQLVGLQSGALAGPPTVVDSVAWGPAPRYSLAFYVAVGDASAIRSTAPDIDVAGAADLGFVDVDAAVAAYCRGGGSAGAALHCMPEVYWLLCSLQRARVNGTAPFAALGDGWPGLERFHIAGGVVSVPLRSRTTLPFDCTNLIAIYTPSHAEALLPDGGGELELPRPARLVVTDPGFSDDACEDAARVVAELRKLSGCRQDGSDVLVFVTHEHHDHYEGMSRLLEHFPGAMLLVHAGIERHLFAQDGAPGRHWAMSSTPLTHGDVQRDGVGPAIRIVGEHSSSVVCLANGKGHTSSHTCLFVPEPHCVLLAGDHVVGYGSAVLDPDSGSIAEYLATTQHLIGLQPRICLPAHGRPLFQPVAVLRHYHKHRLAREESILQAIGQLAERTEGVTRVTMADIVEIVYAATPRELWPAAQRNVRLHVEKLLGEGRVDCGKVAICMDVVDLRAALKVQGSL